MTYDYILGVEGGGSTCRVILGRADGTEIDRLSVARPASVAAPDAARAIIETIDAMLAKHGLAPHRVHIALCLPGISLHDRLAALKTTLDSYYKRDIPITSDAMAALLSVKGGLPDGSGIVIAGTGSIVMGHNHGMIYRSGGKGYPNDKYSGAGIAYECLKEYIARKSLPRDQMALAQSPLLAVMEGFLLTYGRDIDRLEPQVVASLFPSLLAHRQTVGFVRDIFDEHARACARDLALFRFRTGITDITMVGGVGTRIIDLVKAHLPAGINLTVAANEPLDGALAYARETLRNPSFLQYAVVLAIGAASAPAPTTRQPS